MKRRAPIRKNIWPFSSAEPHWSETPGGYKRELAKRKAADAAKRKEQAREERKAKTQRRKADAIAARNEKAIKRVFKSRATDKDNEDSYAAFPMFGLNNPAKRKRRKNPADESAKAFKDFHGKPVDQFVEVKERIHTHGYLAAAGELRRLEVAGVDRHPHVISGFKGSLLAFNEKRNQLFVKGGDQSVNLADFGIKQPHELETLGAVVKIDYLADKKHLGDEGGKAIYRHKFRTTNENGKHVTIRVARYPDLIYRVLEKRLEFSGGSYEILPEGIDR